VEKGVGMLPVGFPDLQLITQERLAEGARSVNYLVVQRPPVRPHRQGQREGLADLSAMISAAMECRAGTEASSPG
jgi:hypothetical protein